MPFVAPEREKNIWGGGVVHTQEEVRLADVCSLLLISASAGCINGNTQISNRTVGGRVALWLI